MLRQTKAGGSIRFVQDDGSRSGEQTRSLTLAVCRIGFIHST